MMSQVKNCNQSVSPKDGLSVKRSVRLLAAVGLTAIAVFFSSCKKTNEPENPYANTGNVDNPQWTVTVDNNMTASMTAIVKVSFTESEGLLAAFIGDDCCGVAGYNAEHGLYWLYISPASEAGGNVQLRFYSPEMKRIFDATSTFPFANDTQLGSVADPHTPDWTFK